jgi:AAA domain (Cdc48 subfamily)
MVNWGLTLKGKPKANFRLLGPPGVGKTEICNAFTDYLLGEDKLVRFDMSEYQTLESIYRLLGHNGEEGLLGLNYDRVDGSVTLLFAVFAIKPVGTCGDVKTRLWSGVSVTALVPDLSIKCDESSSCYPWKLAIVATVFWIGETGSGPTNRRSAWDTNWVSNYGGGMIRCVDGDTNRPGSDPSRTPFM